MRLNKLLPMLLVLLLAFSFGSSVQAADDNNGGAIDEKYGLPKLVLGEALSDEQKDKVRELLGVDDPEMVNEYIVTAEDLVNFINGDPDSNMYSSAKITRKDEGGIVVDVVNPENITQVTSEMYANALLTAGIENALVEVASPLKVSGHSALTGIYKAYNVDGEALDKDRMEVANDELVVATDLADEEGMDQEKVSELLTEIKKAISEQNPATREDVEQIVQQQLENLNIQLSEEDIQMLTDLFEKMRAIDIDFSNVQTQLEDIAADIKGKIEEVTGDTGFWQNVQQFFKDLFEGISNLFS
ncbi:DUF1002 domain-containing protein [Aquibacillus koreensis]|uniref:DUF1002 domain-containing protein n=2 Tax=Aquibacillus koreensis TaxID=279446 RepID=A0A9X3WJL8_9BACI|nr:DUF1002 domain-containing protein [Aquibacillus koreensis]MCT2538151.1 DUF1002 domain-containing protein [Aquibacillus koreensis]MDC3420905.1 DUF1002 domain-containing protein [Aquibacillus koreensis]